MGGYEWGELLSTGECIDAKNLDVENVGKGKEDRVRANAGPGELRSI